MLNAVIGVLFGAVMAAMQGSAAKAGLLSPLYMGCLAAFSGAVCAVYAPKIAAYIYSRLDWRLRLEPEDITARVFMALSVLIPAAVYAALWLLQ